MSEGQTSSYIGTGILKMLRTCCFNTIVCWGGQNTSCDAKLEKCPCSHNYKTALIKQISLFDTALVNPDFLFRSPTSRSLAAFWEMSKCGRLQASQINKQFLFFIFLFGHPMMYYFLAKKENHIFYVTIFVWH